MGSSNKRNMASALVEKAEESFKRGDYLKAAGHWTRAIKKDDSVAQDVLLQCNLCYALLKEHKFLKALEHADAALALDSKQGKAHYRKGLCLIALERWDEAVETLTVAQGILGSQNQDVASMLDNSKYHCRMTHETDGTECPKSCIGAEDPRAARDGKENKKPKKTEKQVKAEVKAKMAAKLAAEKAQRQGHHAKKLNATLLALQEAQKELLTHDKLQVAAEEKEADALPRELMETLVSTEKYQQVNEGLKEGDPIPYDSERVQRFAQAELASIVDASKAEEYKNPLAIVLPGVAKEEWGDEGQGIGILGSFDTAKQHANTRKWVQTYAQESQSHAILLVVPKQKLLYPKKLNGWDCAANGGYYVQLEAKESKDRRMWFCVAGEITEVDISENANILDDSKKKKKK